MLIHFRVEVLTDRIGITRAVKRYDHVLNCIIADKHHYIPYFKWLLFHSFKFSKPGWARVSTAAIYIVIASAKGVFYTGSGA